MKKNNNKKIKKSGKYTIDNQNINFSSSQNYQKIESA